MLRDLEIGPVRIRLAPSPSPLTGSARRDGNDEVGLAHTATLTTPDGFEGTVAVVEWESGPVDVRLVDFAKGADAYRRLERAGTMSIEHVGESWLGLLRALKYVGRDYPTLNQVTWEELDNLTGEDAQSLLISSGATGVGRAADLNPNASTRHANTLAFIVPIGGIETVVAAYAITRILPIMCNFGLSTPEAIV